MNRLPPSRAKLRNGLLAAAVLLLLAAGAAYRWRLPQPSAPAAGENAPATTVSEEGYRSAARLLAERLRSEIAGPVDGAAASREALLALRVPKGYKELHLKLVLAADALQSGDKEQARQLLAAAEAAYPWIK